MVKPKSSAKHCDKPAMFPVGTFDIANVNSISLSILRFTPKI